MERKKRIMIFVGSYLPGTKSAGVTTSISSLVEALADRYSFYIVTADRDIGDAEPYDGVETECWTGLGHAQVWYSGQYLHSIRALERIIRSVPADAVYCNGFYNRQDTQRVLLLSRLGRIPRTPIIIAPRGIFSMGDAERNRAARAAVRLLFRMEGFAKTVFWHAASDPERRDILQHFPNAADRITVIPNLSGLAVRSKSPQPPKRRGELNIIFLSRITEKKNLRTVLECLQGLRGEIRLEIYGMIGTRADQAYWNDCQPLIRALEGSNVLVSVRGEAAHDQVAALFARQHVFFFPTFGENYGHVIAESLANGCPVLLSDTTPWNDAEAYGAGWVYPLSARDQFTAKLQELADMDDAAWRVYAEGALACAAVKLNEADTRRKYIEFFDRITSQPAEWRGVRK